MASAEEHYERLLARHYTWMSGGHALQIPAFARMFRELGLTPDAGGKALDLGCGSGYQSLALAELGFDVTSIDTSTTLLDELRAHPGAERISDVVGDIRDASLYSRCGPFAVAVCMGDTLTHLRTYTEVETLLRDIRKSLAPGGTLILSFRDLSRELTGIDRVIPVRSDADRIMTAFLEFDADHVNVHDLIYVRENGAWTFAKSAYKKLRLSVERVLDLLKQLEFQTVEHRVERGFSTIIARL